MDRDAAGQEFRLRGVTTVDKMVPLASGVIHMSYNLNS